MLVRRGFVLIVMRRIRGISGSVGSANGIDRVTVIMHPALKRGIINSASALGFSPGDSQWLAAIARLDGQFERRGSEIASVVMALVVIIGAAFVFTGLAIKQYWRLGWSSAVEFPAFLGLAFVCLSYLLASRVGLRYVFSRGSVSAFNSWGRLMWSENLTGLVGVSCFTGRGTTTLRLRWADRKRSLELVSSLRDALNASVDSSRQKIEGSGSQEAKDDSGPSRICPACHEENPGNFDECWKCLADRPGKDPS
jgi:hypothetical protein